MIDLAHGIAEAAVRLHCVLDAARLEDRERGDRRSREADALADHGAVAVLDDNPDVMRRGRPSAQRRCRADPRRRRRGAEPDREQRHHERQAEQTLDHATPDRVHGVNVAPALKHGAGPHTRGYEARSRASGT